VLGLSISLSSDLLPIFGLLASSALLGFTFSLIDEIIILRIINQIGQNIKVFSFQLVLIDKMAINLWSDAITPRYFGEKSGNGHKAALGIMSIFAALLHVAVLVYAITFIVRVAWSVFSSRLSTFAAITVSSMSLFLLCWTLVLTVFFVIKFQFHRADFDETTHEPTPEFVREMEAKIAQETVGDREHNPNVK